MLLFRVLIFFGRGPQEIPRPNEMRHFDRFVVFRISVHLLDSTNCAAHRQEADENEREKYSSNYIPGTATKRHSQVSCNNQRCSGRKYAQEDFVVHLERSHDPGDEDELRVLTHASTVTMTSTICREE